MAFEGSRFFPVDKGAKRTLSWRAVPATFWGKVGIAIVVLSLVVGIALVLVGLSMPGLDGTFGTDADTPKLIVLSLSFAFILLSPALLGNVYRQRNARCARRTEERMQLVAGRVLVYEFIEHRFWDDRVWVVKDGVPCLSMVPQRVFIADLDAVRVRRVGTIGEWELAGPIRARLEEDGGEETQVEQLIVGAYFGDEFDALLASYASRV